MQLATSPASSQDVRVWRCFFARLCQSVKYRAFCDTGTRREDQRLESRAQGAQLPVTRVGQRFKLVPSVAQDGHIHD